MEVSPDTFERRVLVRLRGLSPLLTSSLKLMREKRSDDRVHFHELALLKSEVGVRGQLLLDTVAELAPVEVADEVLELDFVKFERLAQSIHVGLDKMVILERAGQYELAISFVVDV